MVRLHRASVNKGRPTMELHCAVDLHGDNGFHGIVDETGKRLLSKRLPNSLEMVLEVLEPYRDRLEDRGGCELDV